MNSRPKEDLTFRAVSESQEQKLIIRFVLYTIAITFFYALLTLRNYLINEDKADLHALTGTAFLIIITGVYFLIKNHLIAKNYITILFSISIVGSFFTYNGILGPFVLDLVNLIIFTFIIFQGGPLIVYTFGYLLLYGTLFTFQQAGVFDLPPQKIYFSPEMDAVLNVVTRIIITTNMILYFKFRLNIEKRKLITKNDEINSLNHELGSAIENLKQTQQQLIQSEKMASIGTLTAGMAHEINNPMNIVSGGVNLLKSIEKDLGKQVNNETRNLISEGFEMVDEGSRRISSIVGTLRTFAFSENSNPVNMDVHEIIENALILLTPKFPTGIKITKDFKLKGDIRIIPEKIHRVVVNVLENAIYEISKQSDKRELHIQTLQDEMVHIVIHNSGSPISEEVIGRVFDPFFTTKEPGDGTGLGLSIAYNIIKEHNGKITATNEKNGVSFEIELPI
ncbi:MAG: GHKL domain-containing protein [Cyclobacteriaceae bacterium]